MAMVGWISFALTTAALIGFWLYSRSIRKEIEQSRKWLEDFKKRR